MKIKILNSHFICDLAPCVIPSRSLFSALTCKELESHLLLPSLQQEGKAEQAENQQLFFWLIKESRLQNESSPPNLKKWMNIETSYPGLVYLEQKPLEPQTSSYTLMLILMNCWKLNVTSLRLRNSWGWQSYTVVGSNFWNPQYLGVKSQGNHLMVPAGEREKQKLWNTSGAFSMRKDYSPMKETLLEPHLIYKEGRKEK